jgi:RNA polymerase sigma-70 factor (ECF subfamily)
MTQPPEERFLAAYDEHADAIFRFCYAQTGRRELALDLTQEAFVRTWRYLMKGNRVDAMKPFLYTTARHAIIDHARRTPEESLDRLTERGFDVPDTQTPDPLLAATASHAIRLAGQLEQPYREAVLMRYAENMMPREIAAVTGESENVISVRITRGIQQLRELLKP